MKKSILRLVLPGLIALSFGVAGAVFAEVASAGPGPLISCPKSCDSAYGCPGSTCTCTYEGGTSYYCAPPIK